MSNQFREGHRFQRGRGIGGLFWITTILFKPSISTIAKAAKSWTGRAIGRALKDQAVTTGLNLLAYVVAGNCLKKGIDREVGNIRQTAALGIQRLNPPDRSFKADDDESGVDNKTKQKRKTKKNNQVKKKGG